VAWLTYDELPDGVRGQHKRAAYDAIEVACKGQRPDDHGPPALTAQLYPSDPALQATSDIHWEFAERVPSEIVWSDDEQSFWVKTHGFWSWANVDGQYSPRIRLQRTGMKSGMVVPWAYGPHVVEPLGERQARFVFRSWRGDEHNGSAIVVAPLPKAFRATHVAPKSGDAWQEPDFDLPATYQRIQAELEAMASITIPLASLSESDCRKALKAFDKTLAASLKNNITRGSIHFSFEGGGRSLGEEAFFQHVESNVPAAVPELRKLVQNLVDGRYLGKRADMLPFGR
jgi:hypothetical protein